jgi:hypothetical protein
MKRLIITLFCASMTGCTVSLSAFVEKDLYIQNQHTVSSKPDAKSRIEFKLSKDFEKSKGHSQEVKLTKEKT